MANDGATANQNQQGLPSKERLLQWLLILGWMFLQFYFRDSYVAKTDYAKDKEKQALAVAKVADLGALNLEKTMLALDGEESERKTHIATERAERDRLHADVDAKIHAIMLKLQRLELQYESHVEVDARQFGLLNEVRADIRQLQGLPTPADELP